MLINVKVKDYDHIHIPNRMFFENDFGLNQGINGNVLPWLPPNEGKLKGK